MIIVDLTPLKNNEMEYEKLMVSVLERYRCDWDDAVHDSYAAYVKQTEERSRSIREIRCKAEKIVKEIESLKIDELISKAEILCREAESV